MPLTKRRRQQLMTWHLAIRVPDSVPVNRAGRFMARLLKYLLRTWGVRCTAIKDTEIEPCTKMHESAPD
jgi:hypothetical protein